MHPYYTTNFADREMFAYNARVEKQKAELAHHLSQPENRIRYCYEFMDDAIKETDARMFANAFTKAMYWIAQVEDSEVHF